MAIKNIIFSGFEEHKEQATLSRNLLRLSFRGALGSGAATAASSIFSRYLVQESSWKALSPYVFKATLASCGTFTLFAAFLSYKFYQMPATKDMTLSFKKLNDQAFLLENGLAAACGAVAVVAVLILSFLNPNLVVKSLASCSLIPLMWMALTTTAIIFFHDYYKYKRKS